MSGNFQAYRTVPYTGVIVGIPSTICNTPNNDMRYVPVDIDWAAYGATQGSLLGVTINLIQQNTPPIRQINAVYMDNTFCDVPLYVLFPGTRYTLVCPPNSVAMFPVLTNALQAIIYLEQVDEGTIPLSRVFFMDRFVTEFTTLASIVEPGTVEFDADGSFVIPNFYTMIVEGYGKGGSAQAGNGGIAVPGPGYTRVSFDGGTTFLTANTGVGATNNVTGGAGGTATGGDVNITGSAGFGGTPVGGRSNGPQGGYGGGGFTVATQSTYLSSNGFSPGGGSGGENGVTSGSGAGGYFRKTYTRGQLILGRRYDFTVGHCQPVPLGTNTYGIGGNGLLKFTWY